MSEDKIVMISKQLTPVEREFLIRTGSPPNRFTRQLTKKETELLIKVCKVPSVLKILAEQIQLIESRVQPRKKEEEG